MMVSIVYTLLFAGLLALGCHCDQRELHIVYMGDLPQGDPSVASTHHSMLQTAVGSVASAEDLLVYSYERSFNGFAAKLTKEEAATISQMKGVVSVFPDHKIELHTTRSWDFMGFSQSKAGAGLQGDVIIGLIDSGAWPEHPSFNDTGFSPPPAKWKGGCGTSNFTCNNKLIGGRYYNAENQYYGAEKTPRDVEGHGTHAATIAAGVEVPDTSYYGLAGGVARGGVPGARVAVYKVCWFLVCASVDILKAFDDAIADGVDIISVSLGPLGGAFPYIYDPIAIGSFHAMKRGILTSASAGNSGPDPVSVCNLAPWALTVAASTIDRKFVANLILGNGLTLTGTAINSFDLNGTSFPLIWGGDAVNYTAGSSPDDASYCGFFEMNLDMVVGKIVVCQSLLGINSIREVNGVGIVLIGEDAISPDYALSYQLPLTMITPVDAKKVMDYIRSTRYPSATILVGETWKDAMAPRVALFSSRGPNGNSPEILKPDISAPGVEILAGWSPASPPSMDYGDTRSVYYNIASGTSMSCPHASAAAAYVKAAHPHWSPAAIKSAIMTTAQVMDRRKNSDLEFSYGSGHINPAAAIDPGLVFDASAADYVTFLCKHGYNTTTLRLITGDNATCDVTSAPGRDSDVNYPAIALYVADGVELSGSFARTVTNVGDPNSNYTATVDAPPSINITVEPSALTFSSVGETLSFAVNIAGPAIKQVPIVSGTVTWSDGSHCVRMPVVVFNFSPDAFDNFEVPTSKPKRKMNRSYRWI